MNDPSGLLGNGEVSLNPLDDASPREGIRGTYLDYGASTNGSKASLPSIPTQSSSIDASHAQIAPWMSDVPSPLNIKSGTSGGFFNHGSSNAELSPSLRPDTGKTGDSEYSDPMSYSHHERRPSQISATTVSSQSSVPKPNANRRAPYRKVHGFLGDDGRHSPRSSDTSIPYALQRELTASSQQSYDGVPISPGSSRPRTPLPSSDVTPWLFQDFKVGCLVIPSVNFLVALLGRDSPRMKHRWVICSHAGEE